MPRFYFHLYNHKVVARDEQGLEMLDIDAAREQAITDIRSIVPEEASEGIIDLTGRIEINDEAAETVLTVNFMEAFEISLPD